MKILKLKIVSATPRIFAALEKKKLIRTLKPTPKALKAKSLKGTASTIYTSSPQFGSHKLLCVRLNSSKIRLNYHFDNEEFLIINTNKIAFKPLYIILGLAKYKELEERAARGVLSAKDFVALKLNYNDHGTGIFTMHKGTPHSEVTTNGKGAGPIFFVAEPSKLRMERLKIQGYKFVLYP